jgi:hypothetical protein
MNNYHVPKMIGVIVLFVLVQALMIHHSEVEQNNYHVVFDHYVNWDENLSVVGLHARISMSYFLIMENFFSMLCSHPKFYHPLKW